jgi:hypothetical protein
MLKPVVSSNQHPERRERQHPPAVGRGDRCVPRLEAPEQDREPGAEQECERAPRLLLDEHPHAPADQVLEACRLDPHLLVEVDEDHPVEREATQDVERVQSFVACEIGRAHET